MIPSLYPKFQEWSEGGSIYIISDTHFDDFDCKYMDPNWIEPQEHINIIKQKVHKPDTLIHLGDVGNGEWLRQICARRKILITGNHDKLSEVSKYFNEIYDGPLFIGDRILLSHEPIMGLSFMCWNIHGHDHAADTYRTSHTNLAANVYHYQVFNLGEEIKNGLLKDVENYHRSTINEATYKKIINKNLTK